MILQQLMFFIRKASVIIYLTLVRAFKGNHRESVEGCQGEDLEGLVGLTWPSRPYFGRPGGHKALWRPWDSLSRLFLKTTMEFTMVLGVFLKVKGGFKELKKAP